MHGSMTYMYNRLWICTFDIAPLLSCPEPIFPSDPGSLTLTLGLRSSSIYTLPKKKRNFPCCVSFEEECTLNDYCMGIQLYVSGTPWEKGASMLVCFPDQFSQIDQCVICFDTQSRSCRYMCVERLWKYMHDALATWCLMIGWYLLLHALDSRLFAQKRSPHTERRHPQAGGSCTFSHFESQWGIFMNFHENSWC